MDRTLLHAYQHATHRLLLLDYDGTLTEFTDKPEDAKPNSGLLALLAKLCEDPHNTVVIVSGRSYKQLDAWLGDLPLAFAAEHGLMIRDINHEWQPTIAIDRSWKPSIRAILDQAAMHVAGSFVEEKENGLVWHYRTAHSPADALAQVTVTRTDLQPLASQLGLRVTTGEKIIEIQGAHVSKADAARYWLNNKTYDFVLAAGDDTTDEDLFRAIQKPGFTIKIGNGETRATIRINSPHDFRNILLSFVTDPT